MEVRKKNKAIAFGKLRSGAVFDFAGKTYIKATDGKSENYAIELTQGRLTTFGDKQAVEYLRGSFVEE